jgi:hypothetical protein
MVDDVRSFSIDGLLRRVESEFIELPGMKLTLEQAQRLWSLDEETCRTVLALLVDRQFLFVGADRKYRRLPVETLEPRLRVARSDLTNVPSRLRTL